MFVIFNSHGGGKLAVRPEQVLSISEGSFSGVACLWVRFIKAEARAEAINKDFQTVLDRLNTAVAEQR